MRHSGINATREVLKDQLALAASEIERLRARQEFLIFARDYSNARLTSVKARLNQSLWRIAASRVRGWFV